RSSREPGGRSSQCPPRTLRSPATTRHLPQTIRVTLSQMPRPYHQGTKASPSSLPSHKFSQDRYPLRALSAASPPSAIEFAFELTVQPYSSSRSSQSTSRRSTFYPSSSSPR